jgi:hypothetical protein
MVYSLFCWIFRHPCNRIKIQVQAVNVLCFNKFLNLFSERSGRSLYLFKLITMLKLLPALFINIMLIGTSKAQCNADSTNTYYHYTDTLRGKSDFYKTHLIYNSEGRLTESIIHAHSTVFSLPEPRWYPQFRKTWKYRSDGLLTEMRTESWNLVDKTWEDQDRTIYTYDAGGRLVIELMQDLGNSGLEDFLKYTITYDARGNRDEKLLEFWDDQQNLWLNYAQTEFFYDASGILLDSLHENIWYENKDIFTVYETVVFEYDNKRRDTARTRYIWQNNGIFRSHKTISTYKADGLLAEEVQQAFSGSNEWVNEDRKTYFYNSHGCLATRKDDVWTDEQWLYTWEEVYHYNIRRPETFTAYPNPAGSVLYIYSTSETAYSMVDMNGRTILNGVTARGEVQLNVSGLAAGIYMLVSGESAQKIVIR